MAFIEVIQNETEYHLEMWNEPALIEAGIPYTLVLADRDFTLSTIEEVINPQ
jgi:hypothetical protein